MRRRIYWVLPDLPSARLAMSDLLMAGVGESHIHFVARENADLTGLHAANLLQTSDVVRAAQSGLLAGAVVGMVLGAVLAMYPLVGDEPIWGMVAVMAICGGLLGAWSSGMVACSTPRGRLRRFEQDIARGHLLLMVDVPRARVSEIEALLQSTHPEARFGGEEASIPAFL